MAQFYELSKPKLVTTVRHDQALRSRLETQESMIKLSPENKTLQGKLKALDTAKSNATAALADCERTMPTATSRHPMTDPSAPVSL